MTTTATFDRGASPEGWRVLLVDDEPAVHEVSRLLLGDLSFDGRPVELMSAMSAAQARERLAHDPDIALVLLDVVMETDDAGLALVSYVREVLGNRHVQILLRTGQPGMAPELEVVRRDEINGYYLKTELTAQRLTSIVISALRTYRNALRGSPASMLAPGCGSDDGAWEGLGGSDAQRLALARELAASSIEQMAVVQVRPELVLATLEVVGLELTLQWRSSQGLLSSEQLASLLNARSSRERAATWLLAQAAHWVRIWRDIQGRALGVSVPLVGSWLNEGSVRAAAIEAARTQFAPGTLDLLVGTDQAQRALQDAPTHEGLAQLRASGVRLTLVDFGECDFSLPTLRAAQPDRLKIHPRFVRGASQDSERADVARSIIALAQTLQIATIADGVDADADAQFFRWEGCDLGQGDALARACAPAEIAGWLRGDVSASH